MSEKQQRKKRIKELQDLRGLKTQKQVFKKANIGERTYRNFLDCKTSDQVTLTSLAEVFGVSVDYLLGRDTNLNVDDAEIHRQTGLSFKAIDKLRQWAKEPQNDMPYHLTRTISSLIEQADNISVLKAIDDYLGITGWGDFELLYEGYDKKELLKASNGESVFSDGELSIMFWDDDNDNTIDLNQDLIIEAKLSIVSRRLQKMREAILKKEEARIKKQDEELRLMLKNLEGGEQNGKH